MNTRRERSKQKQQAKKQNSTNPQLIGQTLVTPTSDQIAEPTSESAHSIQPEASADQPANAEITTQQAWLIEPRDPLIVRDGRPFNNTPGARAYTQSFPPPSVLAGVIRSQTAYASKLQFTRNSDDNRQQGNKLQPIQIYGPLLFKLPNPNKKDDEAEFLCPAPADALLFDPPTDEPDATSKPCLRQLVPLETDFKLLSDFTADTNDTNDLKLVGLVETERRKPAKHAPQFWYWDEFLKWLKCPQTVIENTKPEQLKATLAELGIPGLPIDQRTHVEIKRNTQQAEDGRLFQTRGLSFTQTNEQRLEEARRLALYVSADYRDTTGLTIPQPSIAPLGGERRLAHWHSVPTTSSSPFDQATIDEIATKIGQTGFCRLILLTPAMFSKGYRPTWLCREVDGVQPTLAAIAIKRAQVISGWDLAARGAKPTRRLAPAGTVLFLKFAGEEAAIKTWVRSHWMRCISDDVPNPDGSVKTGYPEKAVHPEQDRRDGFGLAVFGTWDGEFAKIKGVPNES